MTPRVAFGCLGLVAIAVGCGGGGSSTVSGGGGGGTVMAGPIQVEGQIDNPLNGVASGVTTYALTGNITAATMTDANPTLEETEILYSRTGSSGYEIVGVDYPECNQPRLITSAMPQAAYSLQLDRVGKYLYYIRNGNLQRSEIRDGTSNTLIAGVQSFALNASGSQVVYRKQGTTQTWRANPNGSGQALVANYPDDVPELIGCVTDSRMLVRTRPDQRTLTQLDIDSGQLVGNDVSFISTVTILWTAFNFAERRLYVYYFYSNNYYLVKYDPRLTGGFYGSLLWSSPNPLPGQPGGASAGPQPEKLVGHSAGRLVLFDALGQAGPFVDRIEDELQSVAWASPRTSLPLIGDGTPFTGAGALLATQYGAKTPALVVADGVTRSTVGVTNLNETGSGDSVWRIDCDNLARLSYAQGNGYAWRHVVSAATGLKGAIVSFYSGSGNVANIITFNRRPTVTQTGRIWTIEGDLVDMIDGTTGRRTPAGRRMTIEYARAR